MKIVLAHGILGFGGGLLPFGIGYFNGVKQLLEQQGHEVFAPTVAPLASLDVRSEQLARQIEARWPGDDDLAVIGHSMGGLDARRVIHRQRSRIAGRRSVGERIKLLVTVGTPHFGSPVADAVLGNCSPLLPHIPRWLLTTLQNHAGALPDLATRQELHDPDCDGVTYLEVACVRPAAGWLEGSPLFGLAQAIGRLYGPNDGLVTRESACPASRQPLAEWPTDHTEAIGWPTGYVGLKGVAAAWRPCNEHLQRYQSLAERISAGKL
jgi:triacylglycerol lipase